MSTPTMHLERQGEPGQAKAIVGCRWCSTAFLPRRKWQRYCSPTCRTAWNQAMRPEAVMEARELVRLALEGCDPTVWNPRARKLLGIK